VPAFLFSRAPLLLTRLCGKNLGIDRSLKKNFSVFACKRNNLANKKITLLRRKKRSSQQPGTFSAIGYEKKKSGSTGREDLKCVNHLNQVKARSCLRLIARERVRRMSVPPLDLEMELPAENVRHAGDRIIPPVELYLYEGRHLAIPGLALRYEANLSSLDRDTQFRF
jgi:hypothetical protein